MQNFLEQFQVERNSVHWKLKAGRRDSMWMKHRVKLVNNTVVYLNKYEKILRNILHYYKGLCTNNLLRINNTVIYWNK